MSSDYEEHQVEQTHWWEKNQDIETRKVDRWDEKDMHEKDRNREARTHKWAKGRQK